MTVYTNQENEILSLAVKISSGFSFVGSLAIILSFIKMKSYRSYLHIRLILYLSISDILYDITWWIDTSNKIPCLVAAITGHILGIACVMWSICFAHNFRRMLTQEINPLTVTTNQQNLKLDIYYHIFVWAVCSILVAIPFINGIDSFGHIGGWCWILPQYQYMRFATYYIPIFIVFVYTTYIYIRVSLLLKNQNVHHSSVTYMKYYILVFILIWICPFINRVQNIFDAEHPWFVVNLLAAISDPSQGFWNAIVYTRGIFPNLFAVYIPKFIKGKKEPLLQEYNLGANNTVPIKRIEDDMESETTLRTSHETNLGVH